MKSKEKKDNFLLNLKDVFDLILTDDYKYVVNWNKDKLEWVLITTRTPLATTQLATILSFALHHDLYSEVTGIGTSLVIKFTPIIESNE